jgi:hypothetical protein
MIPRQIPCHLKPAIKTDSSGPRITSKPIPKEHFDDEVPTSPEGLTIAVAPETDKLVLKARLPIRFDGRGPDYSSKAREKVTKPPLNRHSDIRDELTLKCRCSGNASFYWRRP